jgi:hypothetical protein
MDFARTIQPPLVNCLEHTVKRQPTVESVTVERLVFPQDGYVHAAYRATILLRANGQTVKLLSDYVFFSQGRMEYSLNVRASARYRQQLVPFESDMAKILVKRASRPE